MLSINVEQVVPKRREVVEPVVGNSLAATPPFQSLVRITDKAKGEIKFESVGLLAFPWFRQRGSIRLIEEGVRTRLLLRLNVTGLLLFVYAAHWLPAIALWLFQGFWARAVNPELVAPIQDYTLVLLLVWPALLFLLLRRRICLRMVTYLHNLVFHA